MHFYVHVMLCAHLDQLLKACMVGLISYFRAKLQIDRQDCGGCIPPTQLGSAVSISMLLCDVHTSKVTGDKAVNIGIV